MDALLHLVLTAILLVATVTDLRSRRIPNWLTFPSMLVALAYYGVTQGLDGILFSLGGLGLGFGLMLIPFILGVMGAGDVKLLAAAGAFLGPWGIFQAFIITSLVGGFYALIILLSRPALLKGIFLRLRDSLYLFIGTQQLAYVPLTTGQKLPKLAYGVAIAIGTILSILHTGGVAAFIPDWQA